MVDPTLSFIEWFDVPDVVNELKNSIASELKWQLFMIFDFSIESDLRYSKCSSMTMLEIDRWKVDFSFPYIRKITWLNNFNFFAAWQLRVDW